MDKLSAEEFLLVTKHLEVDMPLDYTFWKYKDRDYVNPHQALLGLRAVCKGFRDKLWEPFARAVEERPFTITPASLNTLTEVVAHDKMAELIQGLTFSASQYSLMAAMELEAAMMMSRFVQDPMVFRVLIASYHDQFPKDFENKSAEQLVDAFLKLPNLRHIRVASDRPDYIPKEWTARVTLTRALEQAFDSFAPDSSPCCKLFHGHQYSSKPYIIERVLQAAAIAMVPLQTLAISAFERRTRSTTSLYILEEDKIRDALLELRSLSICYGEVYTTLDYEKVFWPILRCLPRIEQLELRDTSLYGLRPPWRDTTKMLLDVVGDRLQSLTLSLAGPTEVCNLLKVLYGDAATGNMRALRNLTLDHMTLAGAESWIRLLANISKGPLRLERLVVVNPQEKTGIEVAHNSYYCALRNDPNVEVEVVDLIAAGRLQSLQEAGKDAAKVVEFVYRPPGFEPYGRVRW